MLDNIGTAAITSLGFFWKAGWAFVLGYFISAMIQAFVPKEKMIQHIGDASFKSISLSTLFGTISSSCSFAALAAGRSLFKKGAHFIATLAFLFASTNLVIELGILIYIFLGWQYLLAEIIGGILLIIVTWILVKLLYPDKIIQEVREKLGSEEEDSSFNWKEKIKSKVGWYQVGQEFIMNWKMVWKEIVIGFTVAGVVATYVPQRVWKSVFLVGQDDLGFLRLLENVAIAPLVAAMTFIGSMGNIPIATVLASSGIAFGGLMAFIYSDLMVPPLIMVHTKYYGKKMAFYIAGIFYVAIIITALALHGTFASLGMLPTSSRQIMDSNVFAIDYTFWLNIAFLLVAAYAIYLYNKGLKKSHQHDEHHNSHENEHSNNDHEHHEHSNHDHHQDSLLKTGITYGCIVYLIGGIIIYMI